MIRTALETKGVALGTPATAQSLIRLERELQLTLHQALRDLYMQFDGFSSCDTKSQMMLWPLERIVKEKGLAHEASGLRFFAIGDFLIDSDFLVSPLSSEGPVVLLYEQRRLAPSVTAFLEKLASGQFDFLERASQSRIPVKVAESVGKSSQRRTVLHQTKINPDPDYRFWKELPL